MPSNNAGLFDDKIFKYRRLRRVLISLPLAAATLGYCGALYTAAASNFRNKSRWEFIRKKIICNSEKAEDRACRVQELSMQETHQTSDKYELVKYLSLN